MGKCYRCGEEAKGNICAACKEIGKDETDGCIKEAEERWLAGE